MNKDWELRDRYLFGEANKDRYKFGGIAKTTVTPDDIKWLLEHDFIDPEERQNDSPSTEEFMEYVEGHEGVKFNIYAVSPDRPDYRVTIEEISVTVQDDEDMIKFVDLFRYADEFELSRNKSGWKIEAWWD